MPTQRAVASLFGLTLSLMHVSAQSVTLYAVSQDVASEANQVSIAASNSVSVAGTDSHGGTTYVDVEVVTSEVLINPYTTITVLSVPTTATFTWVEDASGKQESFLRSVGTEVKTCGFGTDGHGTCVETLAAPQTTATFTFSGNVVPLFTLVAATPSPSKQNAALRTAYMGWNVLSVAVVMALLRAS
ncbi:hypothetical protein DFH08DRAFT_1082821 [Mycena albidolilacea]|uniref:Uncharacterized protein n=1 Tax=Mycena albidolilacea TaxID=1033008 RepID=A0AAD6ZTD5_9AGAR|nr:hypothetical protein DFH08DRAFT_1082821 [Mycena albidolilacea]